MECCATDFSFRNHELRMLPFGDMDEDQVKKCPEVLKFLADNSVEENERFHCCFYTFSTLYRAAHRIMAEMPQMKVG
ncbi:hypothetical protein TNCV_1033391 [Trichonephila clavipes]|nr:hypothetical protein TNCV_1033391 [Trichonephila clavipes]